MMDGEIVPGQKSSWTLLKKLGEGDAGEVYAVEPMLGGQPAILKRPQKSPFTGDVVRQAEQIESEGKLLRLLSPLMGNGLNGVSIPEILDQAKLGTEGTDRFFIVITPAAGFDLSFLLRISRLGFYEPGDLPGELSLAEATFLDNITSSGRIPPRVLLQIGSSLIDIFEKIHSARLEAKNLDAYGVIWNDIKPEHLFWDPRRSTLTLIDWGNGRLLDADRTTSDRRASWVDDYRQLFEELGRYLENAAPGLCQRVKWPDQITSENASTAGIQALQARLLMALEEENSGLTDAHAREEELLRLGEAGEEALNRLEEIHRQVLESGEIPDYAGALRFAAGCAARLALDDDLEGLRRVCAWAASLPTSLSERWNLIDRLAQIPGRSDGEPRRFLLQAIQAAIGEDWESTLWNLLAAVQDYPEPEWWHELATLIRLQAGVDAEALRPLIAANRLLYTLQDRQRQMSGAFLGQAPDQESQAETLQAYQSLARRWKEQAILPWTELDPAPPHCGLAYSDLDPLLDEAAALLPAEQQSILRALDLPTERSREVLGMWERKEFGAATQGLRRLLLADPDRRRLLRASQAIGIAPLWLKKVHLGPQDGENLTEFVTALEFSGRELRNQVGSSVWLERILEGCKQIRRGTFPADLLAEDGDLVAEMPWLRRFERRERLQLLPEESPVDENLSGARPALLKGVAQGELGPGLEISLLEPLDAWAPEARGSSARVYLAALRLYESSPLEVALKLMRMDKVDYALPLFREEAHLLGLLDGVPGVSPMLECGFLQLEDGVQLPRDSDPQALARLNGPVVRIGLDSIPAFLEMLDERVASGWTPYLAVKLRHKEDNLLLRCDAGLVHGHFLPVSTLLQMSIQICDVLQAAHDRNVVYRDHKILHYYWEEPNNGIYLIDWNVARHHPDGLTEVEVHMDLVQFAARGLHHILTGRAAPGALPLGPTRPEEIEQAAQSYQPQWTYDDRRLPEDLRSILECVLAGEYTSAASLQEDLKRAYMRLP
ncbi:MAG: hypothetical protein M1281_12225 [Chloroflexi bacterium]|nr:hypothetical protein [Chloroflexota bacterium]